MKPRQWVGVGILAALIVVTVFIAGPSPSPAKGPGGTLALRRMLAGMGHEVRDGDVPPQSPAVFVVFTDLRGPQEADELMGWARDGGTLVIADPSSATLAVAGIERAGRVGHFGLGPPEVAPACVAAETVGVAKLTLDPADTVLQATNAGSGCFPIGGGNFEISRPVGAGRVVALGGISPFTNALLASGDNAAFAEGLFGSGGPVVFGAATPPGAPASQGLWSSLPAVARLVIIQIGLAVAAFALLRGRRLGLPVSEHVPSPIPASELVDAMGRLYRSARASSFAGETLRRATVRRLRKRLGMPAPAGPAEEEILSSTLAQLSGGDPGRVRWLLTRTAPVGDDELITFGRELEELRRRVEGSWI